MADEFSGKPKFGRVLKKAVVSPVNLSVAAGAAAGAALFHLWPIAALGGLAYAAMVAWDAVSPDFWKKSLSNAPAVAKKTLPNPDELTDPTTQNLAREILAARAELEKVVAQASGDVAAHVAGIRHSIEELEERATTLIARAEDLCKFLAKNDAAPLKKELERLTSRAKTATDPEARTEYQRAADARADQLSVLDDISGVVDRLYANLSRIRATFDGLSAKVVRMSALDAQAMDNLSGSMNEELEQMNGEIRGFESTLQTLLKEVPT